MLVPAVYTFIKYIQPKVVNLNLIQFTNRHFQFD